MRNADPTQDKLPTKAVSRTRKQLDAVIVSTAGIIFHFPDDFKSPESLRTSVSNYNRAFSKNDERRLYTRKYVEASGRIGMWCGTLAALKRMQGVSR